MKKIVLKLRNDILVKIEFSIIFCFNAKIFVSGNPPKKIDHCEMFYFKHVLFQQAQEELKDDSVQKELERKSKEETVSSLLALQAGNVAAAAPADIPAEQAAVAAAPVVMQEVVAASQPAVVSAAAAVLPTATAVAPAAIPAVASAAAAPTSEHQEETYILLVDENSQVDPSQVLYLDPNSLASGNVLLMSQDSNGTAAPTAVAQSAVAVAQQPSVVTTVANGSQNGTAPTQLQVVKEQQPQLLVQQPAEVPAQQIEQQPQQQVLAAVVPSE